MRYDAPHPCPSRSRTQVLVLLAMLLVCLSCLCGTQVAQAEEPVTVEVTDTQGVAQALQDSSNSVIDQGRVAQVEDLLRRGVANHQERIDISSVDATKEETAKACSNLIADPDIYTLFPRYSYSYYVSTDRCVSATLTYAVPVDQLSAYERRVEDRVSEALTWIDSTMDDAHKAQALHDYLVRNCAYDNDAASYTGDVPEEYRPSYTAIGALVEGRAVCQGYADAYSLLLSRAGIESEYVASRQMDHGWNMVRIGDSWYHVDVTWDDPVLQTATGDRRDQGFDADVSHKYFLKSDETMRSLGHYGWTSVHQAATDYPYPPGPTYPIYRSPANDLMSAVVTTDDMVYSGSPLASGRVRVTYGTTLLREGVDYTLDLPDAKDVGTYTLTVRAISPYWGTKTATFTISPRDLSSCQVGGISQTYEYTGSAIEPTPTVTLDGRTLQAGRDYAVSYSSNTGTGTATVTLTGQGNYTGTAARTFAIVVAPGRGGASPQQPESASTKGLSTPNVPAQGIGMYRLYNPNSGEHFYTGSKSEHDHLVDVGWSDEGTGWVAPASSNTPVYRLYNPNAGDHHYTTSASERDTLIDAGWNYEGIGWFSDDDQEVPLYRQYNPNAVAGAHNFTTSREENDHLVSVGWRAEGIGWYGIG